jgi:hypothetical protein
LLFVIGYLLLVICYWLFVVGYLAVLNQSSINSIQSLRSAGILPA